MTMVHGFRTAELRRAPQLINRDRPSPLRGGEGERLNPRQSSLWCFMRRPAFLLILVFGLPARADEPALVIRNATVETLASAGRVERATVVVRDGKIAAIGKDVAAPDDATIID